MLTAAFVYNKNDQFFLFFSLACSVAVRMTMQVCWLVQTQIYQPDLRSYNENL